MRNSSTLLGKCWAITLMSRLNVPNLLQARSGRRIYQALRLKKIRLLISSGAYRSSVGVSTRVQQQGLLQHTRSPPMWLKLMSTLKQDLYHAPMFGQRTTVVRHSIHSQSKAKSSVPVTWAWDRFSLRKWSMDEQGIFRIQISWNTKSPRFM